MTSDVIRLTLNTWMTDQSLGFHWPAETQEEEPNDCSPGLRPRQLPLLAGSLALRTAIS